MNRSPRTSSAFADWARGRRAILVGIGVPLAFSLLVHAGLGGFLKVYGWLHAPRQLTDAPGETVLALPEPVVPQVQNQPEAVPEPSVEPPVPPPVVEETPTPVLVAEPAPIPLSAETPVPAPVSPSPQPSLSRVESPKSAVFAGVQGDRAERVVYVVDASGPMASSLPFVLEELSRSIDRLEPSQAFQVVLFRLQPGASEDSSGYEIFSPSGGVPSLVPANRRNKDAVRAWLRSVPAGGKSVPLAGLRAALELKPDLVFLLTRSISRRGPGATADSEWGSKRSEVLAALETLNPPSSTGRRPAVIKTIQFIDDDPSGLLKAIASIHGDGPRAYSILKLDDLRPR